MSDAQKTYLVREMHFRLRLWFHLTGHLTSTDADRILTQILSELGL